jgi:hypothetical protein
LNYEERGETETTNSGDRGLFLIPRAGFEFSDEKYLKLLKSCVSRIPKSGRPINTLTKVKLRKRGSMEGLVGLTKFTLQDYKAREGDSPQAVGNHVVTFYAELMRELSDKAAMAVMAHELAHAWLNEHVRPEASKQREADADMLAEMWGFDKELAALATETEPLYP